MSIQNSKLSYARWSSLLLIREPSRSRRVGAENDTLHRRRILYTYAATYCSVYWQKAGLHTSRSPKSGPRRCPLLLLFPIVGIICVMPFNGLTVTLRAHAASLSRNLNSVEALPRLAHSLNDPNSVLSVSADADYIYTGSQCQDISVRFSLLFEDLFVLI